MSRCVLACSSVFAAALLTLGAGAGMGCSQIIGIEDLPALDPDARRPPDARVGDARVLDTRQDDARPPDAGAAPDAAVLPPAGELVSRDVLTRYFIDEASSGADVTELLDSAPEPLALTIDYEGGGAFVEEDGNRGLRWNTLSEEGRGRASAPVEASGKIRQALNGATQGTIEVVVDIDQFVDGSRISHIGEDDDRGYFTLRLEDDPARVRFIFNNEEEGQNLWDVALAGSGRTVLHLVVDTTRASAAERLRLYVDGVEEPPSPGNSPPARNAAIDIRSPQPFYVLGNNSEGGRGILGTIFYAAMYSTAFDPAEVVHNATILRLNDDSPAN